MKNIKNKNIKIIRFLPKLFQIFLLFYQIKSEITECSRENPILISNECRLVYCNKTQFDLNICQIKSSIIKTQWLNNIIVFGNITYRYINVASYSNGDLLFETTCIPGTKKRMFYGLKQNGRPLFQNEETPYYSVEVEGERFTQGKYEAESIVVKHMNLQKEFFLSVSKMNCYAEAFSFENNIILTKPSSTFTNNIFIVSSRNSFCALSIKEDPANNYYLFGFLGRTFDDNINVTKVYFQKHIFKNNDFERDVTLVNITEQPDGYGNGISCFQTTNLELIICFYTTENSEDNKIYLNLIKFDNNLENPLISNFESNVEDKDNFIKCIHLEGEVGIFAYYKSYIDILYPVFLFKIFVQASNSFENYLPNEFSSIVLKKYQFNNNIFLNDLIKINKNKIVFTSTLLNRETLFIILFNIFGNKNVKIRYYSIKIFSLYNYKIFKDLRIHIYNNFIAFASSYCPNEKCDEDNDEHYSALMLLSYPNSKDVELYLDQYLFDHNNITINDFEIDLKEQFNIDNNIFGYILSNIWIKEIINNSGEYKLYSSKNEEIREIYVLEDNEKLKIKYIGNSNIYPNFNCIIKFYFNVTEPELNIYDTYPEDKEGEFDVGFFEFGQYTGRLTYYNLILNKQLTSSYCTTNCDLCLIEQNNVCITCKNNFSIFKDNDRYTKICHNEIKTESTQIATSEIISSYINQKTTDKITVLSTKYYISPTTEMITEKMTIFTTPTTEMVTEKMTVYTTPTTEIVTEKITLLTTPKTEMVTEKIPIVSTQINKTPSVSTTQINITATTEIATEKLTTQLNMDSTTEIIKGESSIPIMVKTDINSENENYCEIEEIIKNKCIDKYVTEKQIKELYERVREYFINKNYTGNNTIIQTQNILFQISKLKDQLNSENPNISSVDLGDCEAILKNKYDIDDDESLLIFKTDIKSPDLTQTYVQYEIYDSIKLTLLDLFYCKDTNITINSPVKLDNFTKSLYDNLNNSGYNLFDKNDNFYNDICSAFTTDNGTDILLEDRKQIIYDNNGNKVLCQKGCELKNYNSKLQKAECNCSPQIKETKVELSLSIGNFNTTKLTDSFIKEFKNSNFLVLQCYKLAFDFTNIWKNIGRIIMTIIVFISLLFLIGFFFFDFKNITKYISSLFNDIIRYLKYSNNSISYNVNNSQIYKYKRKKKRKKAKTKTIKQNLNHSKIIKGFKPKKNIFKRKSSKQIALINKINNIDSNDTKKNKDNEDNKDNIDSKIQAPSKKRVFKNKSKVNSSKSINNNSNITFKTLLNDNTFKKKKRKFILKKTNIININNIQIKNVKNKIKLKKKTFNSKIKSNNIVNQHINDINFENNYIYKNLNDYELNNLDYEIALILDKRSFFQYYWSLLKKKQLLFFTFCPAKDYNLLTIKLCLFLLSFSLYFTINGFFFSDETMHKVYEDNGNYNIIYQLPQIFYSSIVPAIINMIIKHLALSEKSILEIKEKQDIKDIMDFAKNIKNILLFRFIIFFLLFFILSFFFWYFITCFCAVYINTQIILFKDTFISFGLSMSYPFLLYFIPGIFRIPSLRAIKKDKECFYKVGYIIALL